MLRNCPNWAIINKMTVCARQTRVLRVGMIHPLTSLEKHLLKKPSFIVMLMLGLAACSSNQVVRAPLDLTIGQQLIDLKKAHTSGALSAAEYDQQRRRLIDNVK